MSNPTVTEFGVISMNDKGVIVFTNFLIDADLSTDCEEVIILDAVIRRLLAEREMYAIKQARSTPETVLQSDAFLPNGELNPKYTNPNTTQQQLAADAAQPAPEEDLYDLAVKADNWGQP